MNASAAHKLDNEHQHPETRAHVVMIHGLAKGIEGVLVASVYHALSDRGGTVTHHPIGDVDGMVDAIVAHLDTPNANVYVGLQVMRKGLARGKRGTEADIVAVLGLVADMDGDTGKIGELPVEPNMILETSPGNSQPFWLFDKPIASAEAKHLAVALKLATGADHGTSDVAHVWRVPGTLNWPNTAKLERGRSREPAMVSVLTPWDGSLTSVADFKAKLSPWTPANTNTANTNGATTPIGDPADIDGITVSPKLAELLAADDVGDRSAHAARVVEQAAFEGLSAEEALALFLAATGSWRARYTTEDAARKDFERLWAKYGQCHADRREEDAQGRGDSEAGVGDTPDAEGKASEHAAEGDQPETETKANSDNQPIDLWAEWARPSLPRGLLPPIIEEFAFTEAVTMGVDAGGLAAAALAACAAAIPDKIKIRVKRHDEHWRESARIWVALVGNPSAKKSPLIDRATRPLKAIDDELLLAHREAPAEYVALPKEERSSPPKQVRLRLEDTTIEAAQEILKDSPNGVLCLQDELSGWFGSMDKYSGNRGAAKDRGFWLQSFNGGSYVANRISRGSVWIENLSVSMLGGIQPDPIRKLAAEAVDDGLVQRLFPIVLGQSVVGKDVPKPSVVGMYGALIRRLHVLQAPRTPAMCEVPLRFDDGAQTYRNHLEEKHHEMVSAWEVVNQKLAAHIGKYDGMFARLCVLFHCVESTGELAPVVSEDTARRVGVFLHEFLFRHALAFYCGTLGMSDRGDAVLATAGWILTHRPTIITVRDVRRGDRIMRNLDNTEAQAVLEQLDAFGWLDQVPTARRDSLAWQVRPIVHEQFAARAQAEAARRAAVRATIAGARRMQSE